MAKITRPTEVYIGTLNVAVSNGKLYTEFENDPEGDDVFLISSTGIQYTNREELNKIIEARKAEQESNESIPQKSEEDESEG